jgi:phosphatidylserine/phosphatidylglycerophosphate/cardiolipin synthase-like enzyme
VTPRAWFLSAAERGNAGAVIDRGASTGGWSVGNHVRVLVHGGEYYERLLEATAGLRAGDLLLFTDWEGDPDERLRAGGPDVESWLVDLARRGVRVRGLLWRSHPQQFNLAEQENLTLARAVNEAGGEVLLDERVRRGGSHHQKLVVLHGADPADDVAFVGGIDLAHGRRDDDRHRGDEQPVQLADWYGRHPPWHDVQLEVRGPAVAALADSFRERWEDPTPLDHRNPLRRAARAVVRQPRQPDALPPRRDEPRAVGSHAVQVLRTYPAKRPPLPFAPDGERSIARAYLAAFARARRLVYVEDQFFWSATAARALADAMRHEPQLRVVAVVPRFPDRGGFVTSRSARVSRQDTMRLLERAGGSRFLVCDVEQEAGGPVYVHAKVCIVDDVWMVVGSANLNRRSWTHDSELSCAVLDEELDERAPPDPAGLGDGARRLARATRLRLWAEHLGRAECDTADLLDPGPACRVFATSARALDAWVAAGKRGPRPPGRVRLHRPTRVPPWHAWWARGVARVMDDPDGRPRGLRRTDAY